MNLNQLEKKGIPLNRCSINQCVQKALERYPFGDGEKDYVQWDNSNNFDFSGDELLIIHILFNLLKNSLYFIKAATKGNITIWSSSHGRYNQLHFKDTASGIPKKDLPFIFDKFFSKTLHGTGIGLTFCKLVMRKLNGDIRCRSQEGEFVEFILKFPKIPKP